MGFLTRQLVPRPVRRATHPVRTVRRAATPRVVQQASRSLHPVDNAIYSVERSLVTKPRKQQDRPAAAEGDCGRDRLATAVESDGPEDR